MKFTRLEQAITYNVSVCAVPVAVKFICLTRSLNFIEIFYAAIRRAVRILTDPKHSIQSITQQSR